MIVILTVLPSMTVIRKKTFTKEEGEIMGSNIPWSLANPSSVKVSDNNDGEEATVEMYDKMKK